MCVCTGIMQWRFKRTVSYKTRTVQVINYHNGTKMRVVIGRKQKAFNL